MPDDPSSNPIEQTLVEVVQLATAAELSDFLLIGGNAVIAYGVPRFTKDIDFVIPEREERAWRNLMDQNGFELIHGTPAFLQFIDFERTKPRIDLMIVGESTWEQLNENPFVSKFGPDLEVPMAAPQHLIAMKLKACLAKERRTDATDWSDIVELSLLHNLNPETDSKFEELVLKFGSKSLRDKLTTELNERRTDSEGKTD